MLTTVLVIAGWQMASRGYPWMDTIAALGVSVFVFLLAVALFRKAVPVLIDQMALEPEAIAASVLSVPGALAVRSVRSRSTGLTLSVDIVVTVDPSLTMGKAHRIADAIEAKLAEDHGVEDVTIHVEPSA